MLATQYKQGSLSLQGIPNDSSAVIVSTNLKSNQLTVRTSHGDEVTYSPHLTKTMTAQTKVYREEQQEFAEGDRIRLTEADPKQGIRKGDFVTIVAVDEGGLEVRLDKGQSVHLAIEQARHIEHGYAVDALRTGAPERVLISSDGLPPPSELASIARTGREVSIYTSDGSTPANIIKPIELPKQQVEAPAQQQQNEARRMF